jgi:hypothetical protein
MNKDKIKTQLEKIAENVKFGTVTVVYTVSRGKIVKAVVKYTENQELLD